MIALLKRSLTGCVVVALTIGAIYAGGCYVVVLLWAIMNLGLYEWQRLCKQMKCDLPSVWLYALGNLAYGMIVSGFYEDAGHIRGTWASALVWVCVLVMAVMFASSIFIPENGRWGRIWQRMGMTLGGVAYISISLALLNSLSEPFHEDGSHVLMGFFVLIWSGDVFAYLVGSMFGRHKLCERLSPSKTWEGAVGGFAFAVAAGLLWGTLVLEDMPLGSWMGLSVLVVLCGMLGDLVESKIKREAGVKDSGCVLPGHGGILDRFDSVLLASPVSVAFCHLIGL